MERMKNLAMLGDECRDDLGVLVPVDSSTAEFVLQRVIDRLEEERGVKSPYSGADIANAVESLSPNAKARHVCLIKHPVVGWLLAVTIDCPCEEDIMPYSRALEKLHYVLSYTANLTYGEACSEYGDIFVEKRAGKYYRI